MDERNSTILQGVVVGIAIVVGVIVTLIIIGAVLSSPGTGPALDCQSDPETAGCDGGGG